MGTTNSLILVTRGLLLAFCLMIAFSCEKKAQQSNLNEASEEIISATISAEEFTQKLKEQNGAIILDVRTPQELEDGYIEGATNIDFRATDFREKINALDKDATYFVYCAVGGRSRNAADLMKELQFKSVYDLAGGFTGWKSKGLPIKMPTE